jgi:hypothetical protein
MKTIDAEKKVKRRFGFLLRQGLEQSGKVAEATLV